MCFGTLMTVHRQCFPRDTRETGSTINVSGSSDLHNYTVQSIILILVALSRRQWHLSGRLCSKTININSVLV